MPLDELLDIVDEHDHTTSQVVTKQVAHDQLLPHRVAAVFVFTTSGKLLVQAHKSYKRRLDHSVGGHVDAGEDYLTAAKREMQEEIGLSTQLQEVALHVGPVKRKTSNGGKDPHCYGIYRTEAPKNWKFIPNDEVDQLIEMSLEEIVKDMNQNPNAYLTGFLRTLAVYLKVSGSDLRIEVDGIDWGEL